MNEILKIANEIGSQNLPVCDRCLGRLFGKLGHNLVNTTRGKAVRLLLRLEKRLKNRSKADNNIQIDLVQTFLKNFAFDELSMHIICTILGIKYDCQREINSSNAKKMIDLIKTLVDPESIEHIVKTPGFMPDKSVGSSTTSNIDELKPSTENCKICFGLFDELPRFADLVCDKVNGYEFKDFLIGCKIDNELVVAEEEVWTKLGVKNPEAMKSEFNRELGKIVGDRLGISVNFDTPEMTIIVHTLYDIIKLQIGSVFIYGRYKKLVRDIPQTRWPCKRCWGKGCENCNGTGKLYQTSVEEQIAEKAMEAFKGKAHFFHGMGREDVSVLMLGTGRPFILEITEPEVRTIDLNELRCKINEFTSGKVEVSALKNSSRQEVRELKAAKPSKTYEVKVDFEKRVQKENLKDVISTFGGRIIKQRTPNRVSHRRADLVRERNVLEMVLLSVEDHGLGAQIKITGESGLYIKELITGDSGRTNPNLSTELGIECKVSELDVVQINDEFVDLRP